MADHSDPEAADRAQLGRLFAEFSLPLTRFAIRRVGEAAAADVVSETFLVAWRRRTEIPADRPGPWLYATANYVIAHEIRGTRRRTDLRERAASEAEATQDNDDDHASLIADRLMVRETLAQMTERDQEVLRLAEWDQLSPQEAAVVLGCSPTAFKVRLHRARRRFAGRLAKVQEAEFAGDDFVRGLMKLTPTVDDGGAVQ